MKTLQNNIQNVRISYRIVILISLSIVLTGIFSCAMQKENIAGRINGVDIKKQDFMNSLRGHFTGFRLEKERTPSESEKRELYKKTWKDITIHVILKDYFKKYQIQVSQTEVLDTLLNNIPASMKYAPVFQTNGEFDKTLYVKALLSEKPNRLDWLIRYYYDYYVPLAKLKLELQNNEVMQQKDFNAIYKVLNSSADIEWIVFDPSKSTVNVTQSDIENYYHSHMDEYRVKPYASFIWAEIPVKLNVEDEWYAKTKIDSVYYQLANGRNFADFVERFSQSGSAITGGAIGFVRNADLPTVVNDALAGLANESFTRPVKIDNSYVIYQLVERTRNLVKLNELVINIVPGVKNKADTKETAIHLRDLAQQLGMEIAAQEMSLSFKNSGVVGKDSLWMADGKISIYLNDRAFTQKKGAILEPVYSYALQSWIVAQVIDVQPYDNKPIISVSDEIDSIIRWERQQSKTLEDAKRWIQNNKSNPIESANKEGLSIEDTKAVNSKTTVMSQPINRFFVDILNNFYDQKTADPYLIGDVVLIPIVTKVYNINPPLFSQDDVQKYYFAYINPEWFDKWLEKELGKADTKIWFTYP